MLSIEWSVIVEGGLLKYISGKNEGNSIVSTTVRKVQSIYSAVRLLESICRKFRRRPMDNICHNCSQ